MLDCGIGFGGMGVLLRQVSDIRWGRFKKRDWEIRIDGIEIHKKYNNPVWTVYNNIFYGDILTILPTLGSYDTIFFGDVLEHFEKEDALKLIDIAIQKANMSVIITTPVNYSDNEDEALRFDNPKEAHLCVLGKEDLPDNAVIELFDNQQVIIINK